MVHPLVRCSCRSHTGEGIHENNPGRKHYKLPRLPISARWPWGGDRSIPGSEETALIAETSSGTQAIQLGRRSLARQKIGKLQMVRNTRPRRVLGALREKETRYPAYSFSLEDRL